MPCLFQTLHAALLQPANDLQPAQTLVSKGPGFRSWLKNSEDDDQWFWPGGGFQTGDAVYIYLNALRKTPAGGAWGFEGIGHDWLAEVRFPAMEPISYVALPGFNGIGFGCGFVRDEGWIYAFGGKRNGMLGDLYVARCASANPEGRWSFWDGAAWNLSPTNAVAIGHRASTSLHVCTLRNKFLL